MEKKVAEIIADFLVDHGVTDMFTITGGAAMHLNDAFGHKVGLNCIYNHHEQACSMAAEAYARYNGRIAAVCVTAGPGGTNAITGVLGGYQDSIPMFIITGQAKRETTIHAADVPLRQLGDQEFDMESCAKLMTKYAKLVWEPEEILYHLEKAWYLANNGRKGPVWLDLPLDVQAAKLDPDKLTIHFDPVKEGYEENPVYDEKLTSVILEKLTQAKRPLIFAGTGINLAGAKDEFTEFINEMRIPVVTAWNAHDLLPAGSDLDAGRPGTVGNRGGNFAVQTCDVLLVLGSRLNIRLSSYNFRDFASQAFKIIVDIDDNELHKPTVIPDMGVHADLRDVMSSLLAAVREKKKAGMTIEDVIGDKSKWRQHCYEVNMRYPACRKEFYETEAPLNHYVFNERLFKDHLKDGEAVICGNGAACVVTFQSCYVKKDQRIFTNSACAAMGYGFPAALGVAVARESQWMRDNGIINNSGENNASNDFLTVKLNSGDEIIDKLPRTICIDGDGSFQMNLQELQAVVHNKLNLKIIIINNNGYHSIRQTQNNLFKGRAHVGISSDNGVSFPDLSKLAPAYGIPYFRISSQSEIDGVLDEFLNKTKGYALLEVIVDERQNFEPKLSSKVLPDGKIVSPALDDMFPFLPQEEYEQIKSIVND